MTEKRITYVCPKCGSDNISRDATAYWDDGDQTWDIGGLHDTFGCNDCDAEFENPVEKEIAGD